MVSASKEKKKKQFQPNRNKIKSNFYLGKHIGRLGHQDPGEFPEEVKALFEKAVEYYEENMVSFL